MGDVSLAVWSTSGIASRLLCITCWWTLVVHRFVHSQSSDNWLPTPFFGQNTPTFEDGPIDVAFSAYLWRVLDVNEVQYSFTAQLRYTLTWRDESAEESIANATRAQREAGEPCRRPCSNYNFPSGSPSVQLPQLDNSVDCCDDLWLPTLMLDNVVEFQASTYYYRIAPCNVNKGGVLWTVKYTGTFFTTMDFRAFPFDKQYLTILFRPPEAEYYANGNVSFVPSTTGVTSRFNQGIEQGDELSSFYISEMFFDYFTEPWTGIFRSVSPPNSEDVCLFDPISNSNDEFLSSNYTSITVVIVVSRFSWYFVWTIIVPITLVGAFGFFIFLFPPSDVGTRFSSIVTLFLALMAVQFVVNAELPASSYALPTQQFIIATYVLYFLLTAESFLVYKIMLTKERKDAEAKQAEAVEQYKALQASKKDRATLLSVTGMMRGTSMASAKSKSSKTMVQRPSQAAEAAADKVNNNHTALQVASSDGSAGKTPEPRKLSSVRFAPVDSVAALPSSESVVPAVAEDDGQGESAAEDAAPATTSGKGWNTLRVRGTSQVLSTEHSRGTAQRPSIESLPSDMGGAGDDASPWANKSWLRRRRHSAASTAASSRGSGDDLESASDSGRQVGLGCLLGLRKLDRKRKDKKKRHSLQEHFYQWQARRYDKIFGSILFVLYVITGVLLFSIPYALYTA